MGRSNGDNFRRRSCFPYYSSSANFRECPAVSVSAALLQVNLKLSTTSAKSSFKGRGPFLLVPLDSSSFFHAILNLLSSGASHHLSSMPKSSSALSPSSQYKPGSDDSTPNSRMSDVALRKKKNADAQAAFRARRANYIATLEETGSMISKISLGF